MLKQKLKIGLPEIHVFLSCLLVALIPFAKVLFSYVIFFWLLTAIILMAGKQKRWSPFRFDFGFVVSILLYLVFVAGVFYSNDIPSALFDIQVKLSLLLMPPVIFLLRDFYRRYFNFILLVFVGANLVAGLICVGAAFSHSIQMVNGSIMFDSTIPGDYPDINTGLPSYFFYNDFSLFRHPSYFSMYLLLCVFIVISYFHNSWYFLKNRRANRLIYVVALALLVLLVYLLASKAAYLTLLVLLPLYFIAYMIAKKKWIAGVVVVSLAVIFGLFMIRQNSRFYYITSMLKNRSEFMQAVKKKDYNLMVTTYGIDRIPIWMISAEIISENFWSGVGSGDVSARLIEKYKMHQIDSLVQGRFNAHNQYLETFIAVGLPGFVIFMAWLFWPLLLRRNFTKNRFLILVFTGILIMNFLFESALNTIAGVVFIAFFYSFLLFVPAKSDHIPNGS